MISFDDFPAYPVGEPGFVAELRSWEPRKGNWNRPPCPGEADFSRGFALCNNFPDPEGLLTSAVDAWNRFIADSQLPAAGKLPLRLVRDASLKREARKRTIGADGITLAAADTEGMRRAIYELIDLCCSTTAPSLPCGEKTLTPWLRNRISRCFFAPIKRAPFFRDELADEIDYYPEAYLDRLASEGVNGLWLTVKWQELASTRFFPEDPKRQQRIEKLKKSVATCRRYGIKLWVFCIEPMNWFSGNPAPEALKGAVSAESCGEYHAFCPADPTGRQYLYDSAHSIFADVPGLGGMMMISLGERLTTCLGYSLGDTDEKRARCALKCGWNHAKILGATLNTIRDGIRSAAPEAELLSWLYIPFADAPDPWLYTLGNELTGEGITLALNFESGCTKPQLGKMRVGGDYWLSCVGPAERFRIFAEAAGRHCEVAAKLQVGCSHECATIPYMPVPGLLYRKYKEMHALGVGSVIQCWYFGNYPGLMNKAAGMLACEDFSGNEEEFLTRLARPVWQDDAPQAAQIYQAFGEAYQHYPMDIQFQYYGPMQCGPAWPLRLALERKRLARNWLPDDFGSGDAIGEASITFTLPELNVLTRTLSDQWQKAFADLKLLAERRPGNAAVQKENFLTEAINILFASGKRIMRYYLLRNQWLDDPATDNFDAMETLVNEEISASLRLAELCEADPRLGYHSEAEVYRFHPALLRWRAGKLQELLAKDFQLARKEPASPQWRKLPPELPANGMNAKTFSVQAELCDSVVKVSLNVRPLTGKVEGDSFVLSLTDWKGSTFPFWFTFEERRIGWNFQGAADGVTVENQGGDKWLVTIPAEKYETRHGVLFAIRRAYTLNGTYCTDEMPEMSKLKARLNLPFVDSEAMLTLPQSKARRQVSDTPKAID